MKKFCDLERGDKIYHILSNPRVLTFESFTITGRRKYKYRTVFYVESVLDRDYISISNGQLTDSYASGDMTYSMAQKFYSNFSKMCIDYFKFEHINEQML